MDIRRLTLQGSRSRISPHFKCCSMLLELSRKCTWHGPKFRPVPSIKRSPYAQTMRPQEIILGSSSIGLPSESRARARADTSACPGLYVSTSRTHHACAKSTKCDYYILAGRSSVETLTLPITIPRF